MPTPQPVKSNSPQAAGRAERRDIAMLYSAGGRYLYDLNPERKQFFCETPAAWELWDETQLLQRVHRWPKKRIGFVIPKPEQDHQEPSIQDRSTACTQHGESLHQ